MLLRMSLRLRCISSFQSERFTGDAFLRVRSVESHSKTRSCLKQSAYNYSASPNGQYTTQQEPYAQQSQQAERVAAQFSLYKGSGAVSFKVISPTWGRSGALKVVKREGVLYAEFANSLPGTGTNPGERRYDWEQKQGFAFSAIELGHILAPPEAGIQLYHDTSKIESSKSNVAKTLNFSPSPSKKGDWFLNFSAKEGGTQKSKINVIVTSSEFAVLQAISRDIIPHLLGFDEVKLSGYMQPEDPAAVPRSAPF